MERKEYPRYGMKYNELNQNYHRLRADYARTQDSFQAQINTVSEYVEIFNWIKNQPWFDHKAYNLYINTRIHLPVDNF